MARFRHSRHRNPGAGTGLISAFLALCLAPLCASEESLNDIKKQPLDDLEERRQSIENELSQLARYSLRSGVGQLGFRSAGNESPDTLESFQIELGEEVLIDTIVLAPAIWRDTKTGFRADGFPLSFRIVAGTGSDREGATIRSYELDSQDTARLAPFVIPCENLVASWVRLEATRLSPRAFDGKYILQLSEIMLFNGEDNVALGKPVVTSSNHNSNSRVWIPKFLTDGSLPYLMDAAQGSQSVSFVSTDIEDTATITIDLEAPHTIEQINLHVVDQSDTVPQAFAGDFGFPYHLQVVGANEADFSDARLLLDFRRESIFDVSPVVMKRLQPTTSRYIKLVALEPYSFERVDERREKHISSRFGFAEIELYAGGKNVALGRKAVSALGPDHPVRSVAALTDGNNLYGKILPLKEWMLQLSKRHDLELELPLIEAELNRRYEQQKTNLRILSWAVAGLLAGSVILVMVDRFLRQRAVFRTKERIAADLHDELGANLHAIALLGDLAQQAKDSPEKLSQHLERIRSLIRRTSEAAKNCTNMLDTPGLHEDLIGEMKRSARRITTDLNHELKFVNEEQIERIKPKKRIDLFLFYNECLVNIIRHSHATRVETCLSADNKTVKLTVHDNGTGLPQNTKFTVPPSLKRRAKLIGGRLFATTPENGGTLITLQMRLT